jgi:superkiller protein 3
MKTTFSLLRILAPLLCLLCVCGCATTGGGRTPAEIKSNILPPENPPVADTALKRDLEPDYLKLARDLINKGFYDVALLQLEKAVEHDPDNPEIYFLMGKCNRESGQFKDAEDKFKKAIEIDPDFAPAYDGLGLLYNMTGKRDAALEQYQKAVALNPARADFYNNLGFAKLLAGKYIEAKSDLLKSLALQPGFTKAEANLALCCIMTNDDKRAFDLLRKNHTYPAACRNMAALYKFKGDTQKALEMLDKAAKIDPIAQ